MNEFTASIHQPDFFPWLGFFNKISLSKKFVVFDNVQIPLGKSWFTRNRIVLGGKETWLTLPMLKKKVPIWNAKIAADTGYKRKHLGTLRQAYLKSPFFVEVFQLVEDLYSFDTDLVIDFNFNIIKSLLNQFEIEVEILFATDLLGKEFPPRFSGNQLILEITKKIGCFNYISGTGCVDFIEPDSFEREGISFEFQKFAHPQYRQFNVSGEFISHMSILDCLFNIGIEKTKRLIEGTYNITV